MTPDAAALHAVPVRILGAAMAVLPIVLDTALKGGLLVAAGGAVTVALRARSAAVRHATWAVAVIAHLALPVLTLTVPGVRALGMPLLPTPPWLTADAVPLHQENGRPTTLAVFAALWVAGTLLIGLRLAVGTWRVMRLERTSVRVEDGAWLAYAQQVAARLRIARPVTLRRGTRLTVPITWGVVFPVVLLPAGADSWPENERRLILVHELAHVRRYDTLTQIAAQLAIALFWFDPLLWLAAWRLRVERERACDDVVLRDGALPSRYAGALLAFARTLGVSSNRGWASPAFAALTMGRYDKRGSEFAARVEAILDPVRDRAALRRRGVIAAALLTGVLTPPLAALRPFRPPLPSVRPHVTTSRVAVMHATTAPHLPRTP